VRKRICWSRSLQKQAIKVKKTRSFCCMLPTKKKGYILPTSPRVKRLLKAFFTFPQRWLCPSFCFALLFFLTKCLLLCKLLYFREKKNFFCLCPKGELLFFFWPFAHSQPTVLFSCTIFLVSGPWSLLFKNSYALCFFFLKKSLLVCKIKHKKNKWTSKEQRSVVGGLSAKKKAKDFRFRGKLKE